MQCALTGGFPPRHLRPAAFGCNQLMQFLVTTPGFPYGLECAYGGFVWTLKLATGKTAKDREFAKQDKVSGLTANSRVRFRVYT